MFRQGSRLATRLTSKEVLALASNLDGTIMSYDFPARFQPGEREIECFESGIQYRVVFGGERSLKLTIQNSLQSPSVILSDQSSDQVEIHLSSITEDAAAALRLSQKALLKARSIILQAVNNFHLGSGRGLEYPAFSSEVDKWNKLKVKDFHVEVCGNPRQAPHFVFDISRVPLDFGKRGDTMLLTRSPPPADTSSDPPSNGFRGALRDLVRKCSNKASSSA